MRKEQNSPVELIIDPANSTVQVPLLDNPEKTVLIRLDSSQLTKEELVDDVLTRGVCQIETDTDLRSSLLNKTLSIKYGTDPTSPNVHIGRMVPILKVRNLQRLGHNVTIILGDLTARIGDTSDKPDGRPSIGLDVIQENVVKYQSQILHVLSKEKTCFVYNSSFYEEMSPLEVLGTIERYANVFSVNEFIRRDIINRRLTTGSRVTINEMLYPIYQGLDSLFLNTDIELGGTDQLVNLLAGRTIQKHNNKKPQSIILSNLINGTDGRKMSSSWGNTVNVLDGPKEMYGKVMSISDDIMEECLTSCSDVPLADVNLLITQYRSNNIHPAALKKLTALAITSNIFDEHVAAEEYEGFKELFAKNTLNKDNLETIVLDDNTAKDPVSVCNILFGISKSQIRKSIDGLRVNNEKPLDGLVVSSGDIVSFGKRNIVIVEFKK